MSSTLKSRMGEILQKEEAGILEEWLQLQRNSAPFPSHFGADTNVSDQSRRFLTLFAAAVRQGNVDASSADWEEVREMLGELSKERARQGFTPSQTASFVFSLKQPLFNRFSKEFGKDAEGLADEVWTATLLLDRLGLYTAEVYQKSREDVINLQQREMLELSTPVVKLWDGILALPLIGTLDSQRTQVVMESLLEKVMQTGSDIAIIDITGVPVVDTLVAQHLLKTVAAARLMGADCIISGIRPQIAQTIVHLGVELGNVVTKASLADAFAMALKRRSLAVQSTKA